MKAKPPPTQKTKKPPRKITLEYLKNAGAYYLGRYASTTARFRDVMMRKIQRSIKEHGEPSLTEANLWLQTVIDDFIRLGYLNDKVFSESFSKSLKIKGLSTRKISIKLAERGIEAPENFEIDDLTQLLIFLKRKRWGAFSKKDEDRQKLLARLARHGFSYSVCEAGLNMDAESIEDYLETNPK